MGAVAKMVREFAEKGTAAVTKFSAEEIAQTYSVLLKKSLPDDSSAASVDIFTKLLVS